MNLALARSMRLIFAFVTAVWFLAAGPLSGQRGWHQGDTWLKWKQDARGAYVLGYFEGYSADRGEGCNHDASRWSAEVNTDQVAASITDFYTHYPEDRDIYIREVIEQLGRGLTLEQIHNYPFWRHQPPKAKP